jgi:hypothetical protein
VKPRIPSATTAADAAAADVAALASAPAEIRLCGTCITSSQGLGAFARVQERQCGGRAVYRQSTKDRYLSFFEGFWRVSRNEHVGLDMCWMKAHDDALHPNAISASWQQFDGAAWVAAPAVSVVCVHVLEGNQHGAQHLSCHYANM